MNDCLAIQPIHYFFMGVSSTCFFTFICYLVTLKIHKEMADRIFNLGFLATFVMNIIFLIMNIMD